MKLVIVESPTKRLSIGHYLGEDYQVEASVGHICDLATSGKEGLGVDVNNDFKATYVINKDKKTVVKKLKELAKQADEVILATDPDREGEAIAYHLATTLDLGVNTVKRLEFHEITNESISHAIETPRTIDMKLVHSQEARRIIDRIIGFKISKLIKSRIKSQSAGRVQSVTLKLICDHEKEIQDFVPTEYYELKTRINKDGDELNLTFVAPQDAEKHKTKEYVDEIISNLSPQVTIKEINKHTKTVASKEPFRTASLQQEAFTKFGMKVRETSMISQRLYEGIELGEEGLVGLITYMRTDSTKLSDVFVKSAEEYITSTYGANYLKKTKRSNKKVKMSQEAHEAIRPTSLKRTPDSIKKYLKDSEYKLYKLIFERTLASLMSDKVVEVEDVMFDSNGYSFKYEQTRQVFDGYNVLNMDSGASAKIYEFNVGEQYDFIKIEAEQNFTKAPARYSEARVVRLMEEEGIGRPSTYASTIQTLISRKYIVSDKGMITPTEQGVKTSFVLNKYFPNLMSTKYTAEMEENLDKISVGDAEELDVLKDFYSDFIELFEEVKKNMYKDEPEYTGEDCPVCGKPMVMRTGKFGKFAACSDYPRCHYIKKTERPAPKLVGRTCPKCGGELVYRTNRQNQEFIGCINYPRCDYIEGVEQEEKICPECGGKLVVKRSRNRSFYGCSNYPECKHTESIKKKQ